MAMPKCLVVVSQMLALGATASADTAQKASQAAISFEVVAYLKLGPEQRYKGSEPRTFSSVSLRMPWAYVLDRNGDLFAFKVPRSAPHHTQPFPSESNNGLVTAGGEIKGTFVDPSGSVADVGDGGHLVLMGGTLLCSRRGKLETYSLSDPAQPRRLGTWGPKSLHGRPTSAIAYGPVRAALVGWGEVALYDIADPEKPRWIGSYAGGRDFSCGCIIGDRLYVGAATSGTIDRDGHWLTRDPGIAVLDLKEPQRIRETEFVPLKGSAPRELFTLPSGAVLAAAGGTLFGSQRNLIHLDTAAVVKPSPGGRLEVAFEQKDAAGRGGIVLVTRGRTFVVSPGVVHEVFPDRLEPIFRYHPWGLSAGATGSYHGHADGDFAAVVGDRAVAVLRIKDGK